MNSDDQQQQNNLLKETFNAVSDGYDIRPLRFFPKSAEHLTACIQLRGNEQVLDVATGTGHAALAMATHLPQGHVTGVDFSAGMLDQARKKAAAANITNVDFLEMDMKAMSFEPASFDALVCAFGIFFVEDMNRQLSHMTSMLKDDGIIAICSFQEDYFQPLRDLFAGIIARYGIPQPPQPWKRIACPAGCEDFFTQAGLRDIRVETKNMGYFLKNEGEWWEIIWNAGFRRMVGRLSPHDQERFRKEHLQEIAALSGKDGIWLDIGVIYTIGRK